MTRTRLSLISTTAVASLLGAALPAFAQAPAPAPMDIDLGDLDLGDLDMQMSMLKELTMEFNPELQEKTEALKGQADRMRLDAEEQVAKALAKGSDFYDKMDAVKEKVARLNLDLAFAGQVTAAIASSDSPPLLHESLKRRLTFTFCDLTSPYGRGGRLMSKLDQLGRRISARTAARLHKG